MVPFDVQFSVSNYGLSPLDVAVLYNSRPMTKMLIAFGAQEGYQCKNWILFVPFTDRGNKWKILVIFTFIHKEIIKFYKKHFTLIWQQTVHTIYLHLTSMMRKWFGNKECQVEIYVQFFTRLCLLFAVFADVRVMGFFRTPSLSCSTLAIYASTHISIAAENGVQLGDHLESLVKDAEARLQEMAAMPVNDVGNEMHSLGGSTGSEKQRAMWERRVRSLKKMLLGFEQSSAS